ncbi:MAG: phosphate acyltransferase PlsX [Gammaproteobacteria bacterium]|nr:phosphate acyltransferase PlsX [Gammaproteobacteria bacterium]MCH9744531.1 phosphate acyltransferase PlsX [Gammaproteobacteria bacterium]
MMTSKTLSIDAMGGDHGPHAVVPAALQIMREHPDISVIFVGKEDILNPILMRRGKDLMNRWRIQHASEEVEMDEPPSQALRNKKDSSMRVAINMVKDGSADACVSAGNTGALMATARFVLKMLPGIDRPAIITRFPTTEQRHVRILDLGANIDSKAEHLYQFAVMGSILVQALENIENPTVGLLNVGEEEIKGNEQVKETAELLNKSDIVNYVGYVEGGDIFKGKVDVVVCDGFVGNIMLKSVEGLAKLIGQFTKEEYKRNIFSKIAALISLPVLTRVRERIDPRRHNGATFIGVNGIVVKSHGGAGVMALKAAFEEAIIEIEKNIPERIREKLSQALQEKQE